MLKEKKKTIGFLINQFENTYNSILWRKVVEISKEKNVNVIFFGGKNLLSPYDYEKQYNIIYSLITKKNLDGIIAGEYLKTFIEVKDFKEFLLEKFSNIPLVTFGCKIEKIPTVYLDQEKGVSESVDHLVIVHNARKIAFIKGPEGTRDAEERFSAYQKSLKRNGIPFDPNLIVQGNFNRDRGYFAAKELIIDRKIFPDAIIGANDETILGVMDFLKEKNIKVPSEIKVVGFDDVFESQISVPSITTIRQPLKKQIEMAFDLLLQLIDNAQFPGNVSVPCEFIIRESCGCHEDIFKHQVIRKDTRFSKSLKTALKRAELQTYDNFKESVQNENEFTQILEKLILDLKKDLKNNEGHFIYALREFIIDKKLTLSLSRDIICSLKNNLLNQIQEEKDRLQLLNLFFDILLDFDKVNERFLLQNKLSVLLEKVKLEYMGQYLTTTFNLKNIVNILKTFLKDLNISRFLFCIYNGRVKWNRKFKWSIPSSSKILLDYRNGYVKENYSFKTKELFPKDFFENCEFVSAAILPVFFEEEHFGYIVINPLPEDDILCESIRRQISTSIKGAILIEKEKTTSRKLKKTLRAFKDSYEKLEQLSVLDELTGLYNRRGLITLSYQLLELSKRNHREFLLFFLDIDGLKKINDLYGHKEGDFALISASKILTKTFRHTDIVARIGGDEFVVLAIDCSINELFRIEKRFKQHSEDLNKTINKPYKIELSYGVAPYKPGITYTLEELMQEADQRLYEEKKRKLAALGN